MLLYLTGADISLAKSEENPQTDAARSLGGFISSTPVPNAALNGLFDTISSYTLSKRPKETIAVALINRLDKAVDDVELKIITDEDNVAEFKIAAVVVSSDRYQMEQIANRYQEPMAAEFHNVDFFRAAVDIVVEQYADAGEEIALYPFGIAFTVQECGWDGTWKAFEEAFAADETYGIKRLSERKYRIYRRDDTVVNPEEECYYITTEGFKAEFNGKFGNLRDNTALISEHMEPGDAIGIWIQRTIKNKARKSNKELIHDYLHHVIPYDTEEVTLEVNYNISE